MSDDLNSRGAKNEAEGAAKETKGKVQGDLGDAIDSGHQHVKGRMDQAAGAVQKNIGKAERALGSDNRSNDDNR